MEIIQFYFTAALILGIVYCVGYLFLLPIGIKFNSTISSLFFKLLLGFILIPTFYALYYTYGYSILIIIPFLYLILLILHRKKLALNFTFEGKWILNLLFVLLFFIIIQLIRDDYFNDKIEYLYQVDAGIYTTVATYLPISGVEVSSPWYQLTDLSADGLAKPYHFGDLWFLTFTLQLSSFSALNAFIYNCIPVLATIIVAGNLALWDALDALPSNKVSLKPTFIAISGALFFTGIPGVEWSLLNCGNILMDFRISSLQILLLGSLISIHFNKNDVAVLIASIIPIFNIVYAPIVFFTFGLGCLILFIQKKEQRRNTALQILYLLSIAIYMFAFYRMFGSWQTSARMTVSPEGGYLFWIIKSAIANSTKFIIFNFPLTGLIALLLYYQKKMIVTNFQLIFLLLLMSLIGIFSTALLNFNVDSFQFFALSYRPLSGMLFVIVVAILYQLKPVQQPLFAIVAIGLSIYSIVGTIFAEPQRERMVSKSFLAQVQSNVQNLNPLGAMLTNKDQENTYTADPRMCLFCNFLKAVKNHHYWVNSLSVPVDSDDTLYPERQDAIELAPFYRFIQKLKNEGKYNTYEQAQIQFINTYKVDFVVVENGASVPDAIHLCTRVELMDSLSGHRLLLLQRPCKISASK